MTNQAGSAGGVSLMALKVCTEGTALRLLAREESRGFEGPAMPCCQAVRVNVTVT